MNDIAEELAPLAVVANVQLHRYIQIDEPVKVRGNEEQLYRMVANLLTNAIHYTPAKGKVTLILESCYSYVMIQGSGYRNWYKYRGTKTHFLRDFIGLIVIVLEKVVALV